MTKRGPRFLALVAATALPALSGVAAAGGTADHLKCYKIKDSLAKATYTATLVGDSPGLPASSACTIKVPAKLLCNPVQKLISGNPTPPGAPPGQNLFQAFLCYKVKCPKGTATVNATDQFGNRMLGVSSSKLLCSPANVGIPVA